jgi:hypothetical protein
VTFLIALIRPFLGYIIGGVAIAAVAGGVVLKIRHDAQADIIIKIEQEKSDAIDKARAARERIRDLCNLNPAGCVPDDWFRD